MAGVEACQNFQKERCALCEDPTIAPLRQPGPILAPLAEIAREGARQMLAAALKAEAARFVAQFSGELLPDGRQHVVRHGAGPERDIQTGIGPVPVQRQKVRDRAKGVPDEKKIRFTSNIVPRWARRSRSLDALLPVLYLRGVSTGDFQEALGGLLGTDAPNLSPGAVTRLTAGWQEDYDRWPRRDLAARRYVYIRADGVYLQARMEPAAGCMLVVPGATPEGKKELVGFQVGVRESAQSPLSGFAGNPLSVNGTRTSGRSQGSGPGPRTGTGRGRRCFGLLESDGRSFSRHPPPTLLV